MQDYFASIGAVLAPFLVHMFLEHFSNTLNRKKLMLDPQNTPSPNQLMHPLIHLLFSSPINTFNFVGIINIKTNSTLNRSQNRGELGKIAMEKVRIFDSVAHIWIVLPEHEKVFRTKWGHWRYRPRIDICLCIRAFF